jgi:hypothetical protein
LDFYDCSGTATGTEVRRRLEFPLQKNAAAENFRAAVSLEFFLEDILGELADKQLMGIADNIADLRESRQFLRRALGITTSKDNLRVGIASRDSSDHLTDLTVGFFRDRTGVHDHDIRVECGLRHASAGVDEFLL